MGLSFKKQDKTHPHHENKEGRVVLLSGQRRLGYGTLKIIIFVFVYRFGAFVWCNSVLWTRIFPYHFWYHGVFICRFVRRRFFTSHHCYIFCRKGIYIIDKHSVYIYFLTQQLIKNLLLQILMLIRGIGGKSNLARKTLIDKRFLI